MRSIDDTTRHYLPGFILSIFTFGIAVVCYERDSLISGKRNKESIHSSFDLSALKV